MKPLVLHSHAVFLSVHRWKLKIDDYPNRLHLEYPAKQLPFDSVLIHNAGGSVSFEAVRFLSIHNVPIIHLDWDGHLIATTFTAGPISGRLRLAQYQASLDPARRRVIAAAIVKEKVCKTLSLLRFLRSYYPEVDPSPAERKARDLRTLNAGGRIQHTLMVSEARIAETYWTEFAKVIRAIAPELPFTGRRALNVSGSYGATDPVNSALNYGYGFLQAQCRVALEKVGLDCNVGFLHEAQSAATPLVYDLEELFRWLVDLTVIEAFRDRKLHPKDFVTTADYKVRLRPEATRVLTQRLSENFNRPVQTSRGGRLYETQLGDDARRLERFLGGHTKRLDFSKPFEVESGQIDASLRERLLSISLEERKALGLSKTTMFYIRHALEEGRPLRLYEKSKRRIAGVETTRSPMG